MEHIPPIVAEAEAIVFSERLRVIAEHDAAAIAEACLERRRQRGRKVFELVTLWGNSVAYINPASYAFPLMNPLNTFPSLGDPHDSRPDGVH